MSAPHVTFAAAQDILALVEEELALVEVSLVSRAASSLSLVDKINRYLHRSGGKRLRPALLLLASRMCGYREKQAVELGVVVELIHVATLVHDDIIDNAATRRGRPSVNAVWGNEITVLMGDWLYMTSYRIALGLGDFEVLEVLTHATRSMVEGELLQLEHDGDLEITDELQLDICVKKTACLFAACARLAAIIAGLDNGARDRLWDYGKKLGLAFQIVDDLLDYDGEEESLGKPALKDLEEGKVTLPVIYLLEEASASERDFIRKVVLEKDFSPQNKMEILGLVRRYDCVSRARTLAERLAEQAKRSLQGFPESPYREALQRLPDLVVDRVH